MYFFYGSRFTVREGKNDVAGAMENLKAAPQNLKAITKSPISAFNSEAVLDTTEDYSPLQVVVASSNLPLDVHTTVIQPSTSNIDTIINAAAFNKATVSIKTTTNVVQIDPSSPQDDLSNHPPTVQGEIGGATTTKLGGYAAALITHVAAHVPTDGTAVPQEYASGIAPIAAYKSSTAAKLELLTAQTTPTKVHNDCKIGATASMISTPIIEDAVVGESSITIIAEGEDGQTATPNVRESAPTTAPLVVVTAVMHHISMELCCYCCFGSPNLHNYFLQNNMVPQLLQGHIPLSMKSHPLFIMITQPRISSLPL
ncbi:hypothetical protein ACH5RR_009180 [Cinchona calisaya]|uniref:Uncharacterized protein n=1 Tax=Cinchona calisaya TaxID=153742 RepID=A0ABD3AE82_9GENT